MRRNLNTLTAARRELTLDDLRMIGELADFLVAAIERHPNMVTEEFFSPWMRTMCSEVDVGTRPIGSSTQQMLDFYKDQAGALADRIAGPTTAQAKKGAKR